VVRYCASGGNIHDARPRVLTGVAVVPGNGLIADERAVLDGEETLTSAVDGAAVGFAERSPITTEAAAVLAESLVADECAAEERGGCPAPFMIRPPDRPPPRRRSPPSYPRPGWR